MNLEISQPAAEKIRRIFDERPESGAIRLALAPAGCGSSCLELLLSQQADGDVRIERADTPFVIEKNLFEQMGPIFIDYSSDPVSPGFIISSGLNEACTGCGCDC
jgi:Fe-S cluster assembly iron-binding protein IscA